MRVGLGQVCEGEERFLAYSYLGESWSRVACVAFKTSVSVHERERGGVVFEARLSVDTVRPSKAVAE